MREGIWSQRKTLQHLYGPDVSSHTVKIGVYLNRLDSIMKPCKCLNISSLVLDRGGSPCNKIYI